MEDKNTPATDLPTGQAGDAQQDAEQADGTALADIATEAPAANEANPAAQETAPSKPKAPTPGTVNASAAGDDPVTDMRRRMAAETRRVEAIRTV